MSNEMRRSWTPIGSDRVICRSKAETQAPVLSGPLAIGGHFMDVGPVPRSVEKAFASRQPDVVDGTGGHLIDPS
jgi:hypothetical protein